MKTWLLDNLPIVLGALVVVVGLLIFGFHDLRRFSLRRLWAISGVCFDESIRRKVLLLTPLAVLGFIVVTQLQRPIDEQDAIRQSTKVCLFTTALLVTVTIIILACTNLPKEIETRVIYTIVTKPTTRLELIVGKVVGFARVSAAILLIMGLASYGYLQWQAWSLRREIANRLQTGAVDAISKPTLAHYAEAGLLNARTFAWPGDLQFYVSPPAEGQQPWMLGNGEQRFIVPFDLKAQDLVPVGADVPPGVAGFNIHLRLDYRAAPLTSEEKEFLAQYQEHAAATRPATQASTQPGAATQPATEPAAAPDLRQPMIALGLLNENFETLVALNDINSNRPVIVPPSRNGKPVEVVASVSPRAAAMIGQWLTLPPGQQRVYVEVTGAARGIDYAVGPHPVSLSVPSVDPLRPARRIEPITDSSGKPTAPRLLGRQGNYGQQLRGGTGEVPVAIYSFRNASSPAGDLVPFEFRMGIEQQGTDAGEESDVITTVELEVYNHQQKRASPATAIHVENNRTAYFNVPAGAVAGGDFDVRVRSRTEGRWLGLKPNSLGMVTSDQPFAWNLFKSLLILWLMTVLIVIISIFTSTFLSWPIAVVLTLVILLGRWGVVQLDMGRAGTGEQIMGNMGLADRPQIEEVARRSFNLLSESILTFARVLPDISSFPATDQIERGVSISPQTLLESVTVLGGFGLPLMVLAYVFLKNKEVAP